MGMPIKRIWELSKIDLWFLSKLKRIVDIEIIMLSFEKLEFLPKEVMKDAKDAGFSDK